MGRHKKAGRPRGQTKYREPVGCSKVTIYRMRKRRIQKIKGFKYKACF
jgi:hypothetical protein